MNKQEAFSYYASQLEGIRESGVLKAERIITTPQSAHIFADGKELLNMCANNYLGLADNRELAEAAKAAYDAYGYGLASVRFICGTQSIHKQLEAAVSRFFGTEDTILYSSCFDANGGLFEVMLTAEDAVISDELNHASIIDGIRLCKAKRYRYKNNDMADLEAQLQAADAAGARLKLIATDGVFSMDGIIANLQGVCDLADKYGAMVMVDDSHASGFVGKHGRGSTEHCGVMGRVDVITGTFGKALGGASGGFTTGKREAQGTANRLEPGQPLIIEGIHGLNPLLAQGLPQEQIHRIFVSALTCVNLDDHNRIRTTDVRLLRRIVRDSATRGTPARGTLAMWDSVRRGEDTWIFPYQEQADSMFNTALHYELPILKHFAYDALKAIGPEDPTYLKSRRLLKTLHYVPSLDPALLTEIPPLSLEREFIGGCTFYEK